MFYGLAHRAARRPGFNHELDSGFATHRSQTRLFTRETQHRQRTLSPDRALNPNRMARGVDLRSAKAQGRGPNGKPQRSKVALAGAEPPSLAGRWRGVRRLGSLLAC